MHSQPDQTTTVYPVYLTYATSEFDPTWQQLTTTLPFDTALDLMIIDDY